MLFRLLDAEATAGVKLTESFAMWPGSSVSGLYLSHPESFYFGVGKIERDQVEDYAARKGWSVTEAERWLAPVLNYIPASDHADAGAERAGARTRQRCRVASARLHLRGASRVSQEGGASGVASVTSPRSSAGEVEAGASQDFWARGRAAFDAFETLGLRNCIGLPCLLRRPSDPGTS
jgi:hypothetical protein